jgi:hypothetical protein
MVSHPFRKQGRDEDGAALWSACFPTLFANNAKRMGHPAWLAGPVFYSLFVGPLFCFLVRWSGFLFPVPCSLPL